MPLRSGPFPEITLADCHARPVSPADWWADGPALVVVGHRDCKTTRETLPRVERVMRRRAAGASVVAVLQDEAETALALAAQLGLTLPIVLDAPPYPLSRALAIEVVPALLLVEPGGEVVAVSEGFRRADLEAFASRLGVAAPLFADDEKVPAFRPG